MEASTRKSEKFTALPCRPEQAQEIVRAIVEMSLLVMGLNHATKRKEIEEKTAAFQQAKQKLAQMLELRYGRPFWPERLNNFHVGTNPRMGGYFDLQFNETTVHKDGNTNQSFRVRLCSFSKDSILDKFALFVRSNNPRDPEIYGTARLLIEATGV